MALDSFLAEIEVALGLEASLDSTLAERRDRIIAAIKEMRETLARYRWASYRWTSKQADRLTFDQKMQARVERLMAEAKEGG
jgi:hypothetical protein